MPKMSVVVPAFNESHTVRDVHAALVEMFRAQLPDWDYEIIYVDDGSRDDTFVHMQALAAADPRAKVLKFANNRNSHMAIKAGYEHSTGDVACFYAADMQDPPELIPQMLAALKSPIEIVWAIREERDDPFFTKLFSRVFWWVVRVVAFPDVPRSGVDVAMIGPLAIKCLNRYHERNISVHGILLHLNLPSTQVQYERKERRFGSSKWTFDRKLKLMADFLVGHSYIPLRLMSYTGILFAILGFLFTFVELWLHFVSNEPGSIWMTVLAAILLMGSMQMVMLGILGEYLWRTLDESRKRPEYIVEQALNFPAFKD